MRKSTLLSTMVGVLMMSPIVSNAQYITEAPAGGFDFAQGSDYVMIYAPNEQVEAIGDKMLSNQNLNGETNAFYYWVADWDASLFTLYNIEDGQSNSWGGEGKLNMTPLFSWGGGHFQGTGSNKYDLSMIDEDFYIHIGFMNIGAEDAPDKFQFRLGEGAANGFLLETGLEVGDASGDFAGVGMAPKLNQWYYLDIPVKDLLDENGDFGFSFDPSKKLTIVFTCAFDGAKESAYTPGAKDPESGMQTITITEKGSAMAVDAVYFYKKTGETGISTAKTNRAGVEGVYDLQGRRTEMNRPGIYVVKSRQGTRKVVVK